MNPEKKYDKFDDRLLKHNIKTKFADSNLAECKIQVVANPDENDALHIVEMQSEVSLKKQGSVEKVKSNNFGST